MSAKAVKMSTFRLPGLMGDASLLEDRGLEVLELRVVLGRDLAHLGEQACDDRAVVPQVVLPRRQVHVGEVDLDLAADLRRHRAREVVIVVRLDVGERRRRRRRTSRRGQSF